MSSAQNAPSIRYRYDALDRLTGHCQLNDPERLRFYCENRLATEIEGGEQLSIVQHGDQLLAQHQHQNGGVNSTLLATDLQRSVLNALQSNSTRAIAYSVYGHRPSISGLISLLGFNGQHPDPVTGHYLLGNGYRGFNPVLMRFNSPDNLSPFDKGGLNAYAYCAGDPLSRSDPTGHMFSKIVAMVSKTPKYLVDRETGALLKSVEKVTRLSEGIVVFRDKHKGGARLTFQGHGSAADNLFMKGDGQGLDPLELINLAESHGVAVKKFDSYRVVACYSGDRGNYPASFAEELHAVLGRPVKGYKGRVGPTRSSTAYPDLAIGETYKGLHYFGIGKRPPNGSMHSPNYNPVTFGGVKKAGERIRN